MYYLNTSKGYQLYQKALARRYFVDKSALIADLYRYALEGSECISITRPRRFGKTMAANMVAAFFTKGLDAASLFDGLAISKDRPIWSLRNSFDVIHIDLLEDLDGIASYESFIERLQRKLVRDLCEAFPDLTVTEDDNLPTLLSRTGRSYIFIVDEWDAVFESRFMTTEDRENYILFLRNLFKNKPYVQMAFMTGILPIAKYSSGSPLNMFHEFNAFGRIGFEQYYGFSEHETGQLLEQDAVKSGAGLPLSIDEIRLWYDGYIRRSDGRHIFNPDSVCKALLDGKCQNNWSGTGPMNDISTLIADNAFSVRDDILRMTAGESIPIQLDGFGVEDPAPATKKRFIVSDGCLRVPGLS